jgi:hypothetical protein
VGYRFSLFSDGFKLSLLAGYGAQEVTLGTASGHRNDRTTPASPIQGLDSTYDASWLGPWLGIDLSFQITERVALFGSLEYHWAAFHAEGNLNLRNDLAHPRSFEQDADGKGFLITLGAEYLLTGPWSLTSFLYRNGHRPWS